MITLGITVLFFVALTILAKAKVKQKTKELQYLNYNLKDQVNIEISKRMHHEKLFYEQKKFADMGQMIGSISHQWRQPLNSIYIISQNIQDEWRDGETYVQDHEDQFKKQADIIHHM
ncbi:MAG: hypothetical protein C0603_07105 [Denitrovibrio sp.]|nr:MAG: hypothetical protein C0603_07105 [Denitrovibrio sp.]